MSATNDPAPFRLKQGQRVRKCSGDYELEGVIVAAFRKRSGQVRYVVEADLPRGLLMIYSDCQLELVVEEGGA